MVFPIDASGTLVTMQYDSSMYLFDAGAFMADNSVTGESVSIYYGDASVLIYYVDPYGVSHTYMYAYQGVGDDGISGDGSTSGNGETLGPGPSVDLDDFFSRLDAWYLPYFNQYIAALGNIGGGSSGSGGNGGGNNGPGIIGKVANWVAERLGNFLGSLLDMLLGKIVDLLGIIIDLLLGVVRALFNMITEMLTDLLKGVGGFFNNIGTVFELVKDASEDGDVWEYGNGYDIVVNTDPLPVEPRP